VKDNWSKQHLRWLTELILPHPAQQIALQEYIQTLETLRQEQRYLTPSLCPCSWMNLNRSDVLPLDTVATFLANHSPASVAHFIYLSV